MTLKPHATFVYRSHEKKSALRLIPFTIPFIDLHLFTYKQKTRACNYGCNSSCVLNRTQSNNLGEAGSTRRQGADTSSTFIQYNYHIVRDNAWWRHEVETFTALLASCAGNSSVTGEFPAQRPVTRSFDIFFDLHPNKRFSKQSWGWWFHGAHYDVTVIITANTYYTYIRKLARGG